MFNTLCNSGFFIIPYPQMYNYLYYCVTCDIVVHMMKRTFSKIPCDSDGARTHDPDIKSVVLYQLSSGVILLCSR